MKSAMAAIKKRKCPPNETNMKQKQKNMKQEECNGGNILAANIVKWTKLQVLSDGSNFGDIWFTRFRGTKIQTKCRKNWLSKRNSIMNGQHYPH